MTITLTPDVEEHQLRRGWAVVVVTMVLACLAHSMPAQTDTTRESEVADEAQVLAGSLIDDLTGPDETARTKASKQLVGIGDAAIAPLQMYLRGAHPAASKQRVQAVLDEMETHFRFQPTLVTIKMQNVHPREVFRELSKQGAITIEPQFDFWGQNVGYDLPKKISVDIQNQPFWLALIDVGAKAKVGVRNYGQGQRIGLSPGGDNYDGVRFLSGPVLYVASNIDRNVVLHANGQTGKRLTLHLQAFVDPKLKMLGYSSEVMADQAIGDDGGSLAAPWQKQMDTGNGGNGLAIDLSTPLLYETGKNTRIATFKGAARLRIASGSEKVEIADPLNAIGRKVHSSGVDVTLKNFFKNSDNSYEVKVQAVWQIPIEEQINWWMITTLHLYDAQGNEYVGNHQSSGGSPNFELAMHFVRPSGTSIGDVTKLLWEPVTVTRKIKVPLELKDIPLPVP